MKFYLYSHEGDGMFLARRLIGEGHEVAMYTEEKAARFGGRGLVPTVGRVAPLRGEITLFDYVKHGVRAESYRGIGPVVGACRFADKIELDRAAGFALMRDVGISTPETHTFPNVRAALLFLEENDGEFFLKASGNASSSLTHSAPNSDEMIRWLRWADVGAGPLSLQKRVRGLEVSTEGWFDGSAFVPPWNSTLEDKHFLTGDLGPRVGCASNFVFCWPDRPPFLSPQTIEALSQKLREAHYVGPLDLNAILDEDGVAYGLEWTARFGYDALQGFTSLIDDVGEKLAAFANGTLTDWKPRRAAELALTLNLSVPPYPAEDPVLASLSRGLPLPDEVLAPDFCPCDVMIGEDGLPCLAGYFGGVGSLICVGSDPASLRRWITQRARSFAVPSLQFRIDPVARLERVADFISDVYGDEYLPATLRPSYLYSTHVDALLGPLADELPQSSRSSLRNDPRYYEAQRHRDQDFAVTRDDTELEDSDY